MSSRCKEKMLILNEQQVYLKYFSELKIKYSTVLLCTTWKVASNYWFALHYALIALENKASTLLHNNCFYQSLQFFLNN